MISVVGKQIEKSLDLSFEEALLDDDNGSYM